MSMEKIQGICSKIIYFFKLMAHALMKGINTQTYKKKE